MAEKEILNKIENKYNFKFEANYKGKLWRVKELDWFTSSGCTKNRPSWVTLERAVLDDNGEHCRTDEEEVLSDEVELILRGKI